MHFEMIDGLRKAREILVSTALILAVTGISARGSSANNEPRRVRCDVHRGSCTADLAGGTIILDIQPKPVRAMRDLTFTLMIEGDKPDTCPYIDLGMPGMNMGRNRVVLKPLGEGAFQGEGIIVRCPSGRRTWKATVTVPAAGSVEFVFDVIY